MSAILNFLGTLIKTGAILGVVTIGTAGVFAYATKPDEKLLRNTIGKNITGQTNRSISILGSLVAGAASAGSNVQIKDFLFFKTAEVTTPAGEPQVYIGAFQNWFSI